MEVLTKPQKTSTDNEVIVELQTDAPLKVAIMPNGGRRMVLSSLKTYAMTRPVGRGPFKKYRTYSTDSADSPRPTRLQLDAREPGT